jgi:hypothetical protein
MDNTRRPRHIRDIAHLYISRSASKDGSPPKRVYITPTSRECFGGYHAANIALGFAHKGYAVQLMEISDTVPCSAYFLRLPPSVYLKQKARVAVPSQGAPTDSFSAMGGVMVRFKAPPNVSLDIQPEPGLAAGITAGLRRRTAGAVDVFHLPPASDVDALNHALDRATDFGRADAGARAVVLAPSEAEAHEAGNRIFGRRPRIAWVTMSLGERSHNADRSQNGRQHLGYLAGWRPLLADPLPCLVRDPESHVSRSYFSVCDALLSLVGAEDKKYESKTQRKTASFGRFR